MTFFLFCQEKASKQTKVLHMKRLNQTESPIFVILCVLCFQRQSFFTFIQHFIHIVSLGRRHQTQVTSVVSVPPSGHTYVYKKSENPIVTLFGKGVRYVITCARHSRDILRDIKENDSVFYVEISP